MITKKEIWEWWGKKVTNYIHNYARHNKLTTTQTREKFFSEAHEKFIEVVPHEIHKFLDIVNAQVGQKEWKIVDEQTL